MKVQSTRFTSNDEFSRAAINNKQLAPTINAQPQVLPVTNAQPTPVILENVRNMYYLAPVTIGGQSYKVVVDTGSSNMWIRGLVINENTHVTKKVKHLSFNAGNATSVISHADVMLGDIEISDFYFLYAQQQVFFKAKAQYPYDFDIGDGIIGLCAGNQSVDALPYPSFLDSANIQKFNLYLTNGRVPSEFSVGEPDINKFTGEMGFENVVDDRNFWEIQMTGVGTSSKRLILTVKETIIDSGTPFIMLSLTACHQINTMIGATINRQINAYVINCASALSAPPLEFTMASGSVYSIPASIYIITHGEMCISAISWYSEQSATGKRNILGATFLRAMFSHFDRSGKRIGFASAKYL